MLDEEIIKLYQDGKSVRAIAKDSGHSFKYIRNILLKNNIQLRPKKLILSRETEQYLIKEYLSGKSIIELSEEIGHDKRFVSEIIHKYGVRKAGTKYNLNERFFDEIDCEAKAYFLGLLYADGCNEQKDNRSYRIRINLQEGDKHILEELARQIKFDGSLTKIDKGEDRLIQYGLCIGNKYMSMALNKLGCTPAKSLTLKWPDWLVDQDLQRHFIRGYFDGDGCISSYLKNQYTGNQCYTWQITSTIYFCEAVQRIITNHLKLTSDIRRDAPDIKNDITKVIRVRGNKQVLSLCQWMYKDATIYLTRKYNKFLLLKEQCDNLDINGRKMMMPR